jgi:hypothetical protein
MKKFGDTNDKIEVGDGRLMLRASDDSSISPLIEEALQKGWKSVSIRGHRELCRATWLEASVRGLTVTGYTPDNSDLALLEKLKSQKKDGFLQMKADEVVIDYMKRVIPTLQKEYEGLRQRRAKLGVTTTDIDRTYGLNLPSSTYAREVDDKFQRARGALMRAIDDREKFALLGKKQIEVQQSFEDGVCRFVLPRHMQNTARSRYLSQGLKNY